MPRALLLALALLQALGVTELVRRETCEAECKRDGCDGDCTPDRDAPQCPCHCPSGVTNAPPTLEVTIAPARQHSEISFDAEDQLHATPDPREILHVPRQHAI